MGMLLEEGSGSRFEILDEDECRTLLEGATIGRVAVSLAAIPAVFPVNYVIDHGDIYFLTGEGTKLRAAVNEAVVAFEVDEVDAEHHEGWSVLAVGKADEMEGEVAERLSDLLALHPWAPGQRSHLVRVHPEFVSGRRITAEDG